MKRRNIDIKGWIKADNWESHPMGHKLMDSKRLVEEKSFD